MGCAEGERLKNPRRYGLTHAAFNDIAALAAFICPVPISLITLVDSHRQWFLSRTGIEACETSRDASFCAHALVGTDMLIVETPELTPTSAATSWSRANRSSASTPVLRC